MPKNRKVIKNGNTVTVLSVPSKLRIGTRKSGTSALLMTTEALKDVLTKKDNSRYHNKARTVLAMRGVTV